MRNIQLFLRDGIASVVYQIKAHPVEKIHVAVLAALAALDAAVPWIPDVVQEAHLLSVPIIIIAARTGNKSTPCTAPPDVIRLNKI